VTNGNILHANVVALENFRHFRHEFVELRNGNEILAKHERRLGPTLRLEFVNIVARLVVSERDDVLRVEDRFEDVPSEESAERIVRKFVDDERCERILVVARNETFFDGERLVRLDPRDCASALELRGMEIRVVEDDFSVARDVLAKVRRVFARFESLRDPLHPPVRDDLERRFGDHSHPAVAADRRKKQLGILFARRIRDRAVRKHDADRTHRLDDGTSAHVAAVRVDAERTADREVRVGLHDLDREIVTVDLLLNVTPRRARLDRHRGRLFVDAEHPVEAAHIEVKTPGFGDLPPHATARTSNGDGTLARSQRFGDLFRRLRPNDTRDLDFFDSGDFAHRPLSEIEVQLFVRARISPRENRSDVGPERERPETGVLRDFPRFLRLFHVFFLFRTHAERFPNTRSVFRVGSPS
jgi:hypothetical protein